MSRRRTLIWGMSALVYGVFFVWYTDLGGPLSDAEIEMYLDRMETIGFNEEQRDRIRVFMETDTGRQFLMVNVIDFADDPPDVPGAEPGESARELIDRYMEHMYRELFIRASHPVVVGDSAFVAIDLVGVEELDTAERWDSGAMFRYRSRRTFFEILTNPETIGRHEFKVAALDKTIAYPIETQLNLGDPRVILGLLLLAGAALADLFSTPRRPLSSTTD